MSKRKLYPATQRDRLLFWTAIVFVPSFAFTLRWFTGLYVWIDWISILIATLGSLMFVYLIQDRPNAPEDYASANKNIEEMRRKLADLGAFFERERERISDSETRASKLRDERSRLELVVGDLRDIVNAVSAAGAWKKPTWNERFLRYMGAVFISVLAALTVMALRMAFEYFRRR